MPRKVTEENYAEIYRDAAQEHIALAKELHDGGRYVMAHYLAGLAAGMYAAGLPLPPQPGFQRSS